MRVSGEKPPIATSVVVLSVITAAFAYVVYRNGTLSSDTLIALAVLAPSVVLHEISHGWLANAYGDPTAKHAGRLTLNPLRHVDPLGTFIVPGVLLLSGAGTAFGWAKPVPVNVSGMSRNRAMFVGLVGPATNLLLLVIATLLIHIVYNTWDPGPGLWDTAMKTLLFLGRINIVLAIFNMIPIPPLDGSSVVERFLPREYMQRYLQFRQYSMILLLVFMVAFGRIFSFLFDPAIRFWLENFMPFPV